MTPLTDEVIDQAESIGAISFEMSGRVRAELADLRRQLAACRQSRARIVLAHQRRVYETELAAGLAWAWQEEAKELRIQLQAAREVTKQAEAAMYQERQWVTEYQNDLEESHVQAANLEHEVCALRDALMHIRDVKHQPGFELTTLGWMQRVASEGLETPTAITLSLSNEEVNKIESDFEKNPPPPISPERDARQREALHRVLSELKQRKKANG